MGTAKIGKNIGRRSETKTLTEPIRERRWSEVRRTEGTDWKEI
jgi:hypothetical protein